MASYRFCPAPTLPVLARKVGFEKVGLENQKVRFAANAMKKFFNSCVDIGGGVCAFVDNKIALGQNGVKGEIGGLAWQR